LVGGWRVRSRDQTVVLVGKITYEFPRLVLSREFQSTCFALRSPAIKTDLFYIVYPAIYWNRLVQPAYVRTRVNTR